ncbi:MAG: hypothetical protein H7293_20040 [Candidatus Saccharibacteria bacterium]|nr:hypothetical protein [Rhodoferax sp.]
MPSIDRGGNDTVLSSDWTGLSRHLIASFYPVHRTEDGNWYREPNSVEVQAPLSDGTIDQTINWISPFENQTADAKLATLSALLQAGGFSAILNSLQERVGKDSVAGGLVGGLKDFVTELEGKSAVTKLNSTQIFSGMPPMKITATAHFRAMFDADKEVRQPMDQLMQWALPKKLSNAGYLTQLADANTEKGIRTVYPSAAPQIIGMQYADCVFVPMVFETMPRQLTGSRDSNGRLIHSPVTFTLGSLTALDKDDWIKSRLF